MPKSLDSTLKNSLKTAIAEAIAENEELVRRIVSEAIEDAFLAKAIQEGKRSRRATRAKVMAILAR